MNKLPQDPRPSPRLENMGFIFNPFSWRNAELMRPDVLEETYTPHPGFNETIMNFGRSSVLLAPFGGGKTAGRLRLTVELIKKRKEALKNSMKDNEIKSIPLIVDYTNFESIVNQLPAITLENHKLPLLGRIAEAFYQFISSYDDLFLNLPARSRDFWWAFLEEYRLGITSSLDLPDGLLLNDRNRTQTHQSPFVEGTAFSEIIKILIEKLHELSISPIFILVDGIDAQVQDPISLEALPLPLLNHLGLISIDGLVWKFFFPNSLNDFVRQSSSYRSGRLDILSIKWDKNSLNKFLHERLLWASGGGISDVAQNCDQDLLMKLGDVDAKLIEMALHHTRLGPPRALLDLANILYHCGDRTQITVRDWEYFNSQVQQDLNIEEIYRSMIVGIKGKKGKIAGTGFMTLFNDQVHIITCAHVVHGIGITEGGEVELARMDSGIGDFKGKVVWCRPPIDIGATEWSAYDDLCIILPQEKELIVNPTLQIADSQDEYEDLLGCWCFGYLASKSTKGEFFKDINSEKRVGDDFVRLSQRSAISIDKGVSGAPLYSPSTRKIIGIIQAVAGKEVAYLIPGYVIHRVLEKLTQSN